MPEPKTVKNRMHGDVTLLDASVESLVADGATVVRPRNMCGEDDCATYTTSSPFGNGEVRSLSGGSDKLGQAWSGSGCD